MEGGEVRRWQYAGKPLIPVSISILKARRSSLSSGSSIERGAVGVNMLLTGKVVVVTGGAGRLGQIFCRTIAGEGGIPVVADVAIEAATRIAQELRDQGHRAEAIELDITRRESVEHLIAETQSRCGQIDAVVNNAYPRNANYGRRIEDVEYADFCENVSLHLGGYFLIAQKFALFFHQCGKGNIVNLSSIYGVIAPRFDIYENTSITTPVEYAAIKSAVIHLTRYFAQYFKKSGVRCNALSPGGIEAGQPQVFLDNYNRLAGEHGMLHADDISGALVFLLSDASRMMTGQNLVVDDGFSL
jgi:NAD(P)-dependent dehydrogenase (short-subunit alcohol dehydrogenase family)